MSSSDKPREDDPDIEDGEITDDDEEPTPTEPVVEPQPNPATAGAPPTIPVLNKSLGNVSDSESIGVSTGEPIPREVLSDRERLDEKDRIPNDGRERDRTRNKKNKDKGNREDKAHRYMTEAEKSILHLRKREKMLRDRDKWDKQHHTKHVDPLDDDFAKNIEKTLATILHKKEKEVAALTTGEEPLEEKRGKKRKKEQKDKKNKRKRVPESPRSEIDESEMLNVRSGSPGAEMRLPPNSLEYGPQIDQRRSRSISKSEESFNEYSSDEREERAKRTSIKNRRKKEKKRERREREQRRAMREEQSKMPLQDSQGVCVFYLQGKCQKSDCPYSHEVSPPMKLELCKFYLMDCCAKGENCSYMHSEFPCKFYHTGLQCIAGKECKFAHGQPLSEGLKQILFKHIETAPRDILQGFPRLSRDEAFSLINQTQKKLVDQYNQGSPDQSSLPSTVTSGNTSSPPLRQSQSSSGGLGMYKEDYPMAETMEREKEAAKGGIPSLFDITVPVPRELAQGLDFEPKMNKNERRTKTTRWQQDNEPNINTGGYPGIGFSYGSDQDMRISSNGDIDMRTLPSVSPNSRLEKDNVPSDLLQNQNDLNRSFTEDIDIRQPPPFIRKQSDVAGSMEDSSNQNAIPNLEFAATTKDLIARINANQKDNTVEVPSTIRDQKEIVEDSYNDQNINWYSDDDDDDENRLTIEDEDHQKKDKEDSASDREGSGQEDKDEPVRSSFLAPSQFSSQTADIVGKLGDLSKIDISDEVTKLLTSMSRKTNVPEASFSNSSVTSESKPEGSFSPPSSSGLTDPRVSRQQSRSDPRQDSRQETRPDPRLSDPRQRDRQHSTESKEKEKKADKMSIYEQGGMEMKKAALDIDNEDFKCLRPDLDIRKMSLPFKGMQNYTPATEIDATINSHPPMIWKVIVVDIPRPDYTGLKISISDAEKTGDPRLRKIFRLSVDEKDSPASPKASPKHSSGARVDPRLRKMDDKIHDLKDMGQNPQMSYNQQLSMLQSSQFYLSLTSNQKLMLNQELARNDQSDGTGMNDPVLNTLLSRLNIIPQAQPSQLPNQMMVNSHMGTAVSILANINKMNQMIPTTPMMNQQGLLGAAPGIPNMPPGMSTDYPMNFDPRGGPGLLGNAPNNSGFGPFGGGMDQPPYGGGGYNDDFYGGFDDQGNMEPPPNNVGPQRGNFRQGRGNYRDNRRRGNRDGFRGGRGNMRGFNKRGGMRDKGDRGDKGDRDRGRDRGRGYRGHSPP